MKDGSLLALSLAGMAMCVGGCVAVPRLTSATTPWVPPREATRPDSVWKGIREQKADFSKPLTLAELVDRALANNPACGKAWNDARAAAAQVEQTKGYFMPAFTAAAGAGRQYTQASPDGFDQSFQKLNLGVQMNYLVINFGGGRVAAVEQALQTVYAADFGLNRAIQDVLLAVSTAYYGLISAQAGVEAATAGVKDAKTALDAAQERAKQGVGTRLDVLQTETTYYRSAHALAGAQGALRIAEGGLAQVLGFPADTTIAVVPPTVEVPEALPVQDIGRLIDQALARRPDIAALRSTLAAREAAVKVAGAALWPSLYLNGAINRDAYDRQSGRAMQDDDWSYGGGISLQWTVFDGFMTSNAKRAAQAQADSTRAQLRQAELAAGADVWARYHNYETARQKHKASAAYLASASRLYDLALDSYKNGLTSILDLVTAEDLLAQARSQNIAARQEVFTALANLAAAAGLLQKGEVLRAQNGVMNPTGKDNQP
jgi:outer membrane protein TolC